MSPRKPAEGPPPGGGAFIDEQPAFMVGEPLYRGTLLIRKRTPLGPYRRPMPRVLGWSLGGGRFLIREVPLYTTELN